MGRSIEMSPSPLDGELAPSCRAVVPTLPWDLKVQWSPGVLAALSDASRAIGRLEGARRAANWSIESQGALAAIEAWSCVLVAGMSARWGHVAREFAEDSLQWREPKTGAEAMATLIGFHLGLEGYGASRECDGAISNEFYDGLVVSPHVRVSLMRGVHEWMESSSGADSALLRSVLTMMYIAASCPESREVGMVARVTFPWLLQSANGADVLVPISLGFVNFSDEWDKVARALAVDGRDDPDAVNEAVRCALRAVERAAVTAGFEVESVKYGAQWHLNSQHNAWFDEARPSVRHVFRAVYGLPSITRQNLEHLTGFSTRTVNTAVRILVEHGVVTVKGKVWGSAHYSVWSRRSRPPCLASSSFYPSVSAAPDENR